MSASNFRAFSLPKTLSMVCCAGCCRGQISEPTSSLNVDPKMETDVDRKTKDTCRRNMRWRRVHRDGTAVLDLEKSRRRVSKRRSLLTGRHGLGVGYSKDIATLHAMSRSWSKLSHKESITVLLTARLFLRTNWESAFPWLWLILCPRFQQHHNLTWHWFVSSLKSGELLCQLLRTLNKTHVFNVYHSKISVVRVHINSTP